MLEEPSLLLVLGERGVKPTPLSSKMLFFLFDALFQKLFSSKMVNNKIIDHHPMKGQLLVFLTLLVQLSGVLHLWHWSCLLPEPVLTAEVSRSLTSPVGARHPLRASCWPDPIITLGSFTFSASSPVSCWHHWRAGSLTLMPLNFWLQSWTPGLPSDLKPCVLLALWC